MKLASIADRINELYSLDIERGLLISKKYARPVGAVNADGYLTVSVDGQTLYAHRVIYFLATGSEPQLVDHIDNNRQNNTPRNLRGSTPRQNQMNRRHQGRGIYRRGDKWIAQVSNRYIGIFPTEELALEARAKALISPTLKAA